MEFYILQSSYPTLISRYSKVSYLDIIPLRMSTTGCWVATLAVEVKGVLKIISQKTAPKCFIICSYLSSYFCRESFWNGSKSFYDFSRDLGYCFPLSNSKRYIRPFIIMQLRMSRYFLHSLRGLTSRNFKMPLMLVAKNYIKRPLLISLMGSRELAHTTSLRPTLNT